MLKVKPVKYSKGKPKAVLWIVAAGFSFLIAMSWLTEVLSIPHYLFGDPFVPNWHRALLRTSVIALIWLWVHLLTRRLLKRLHHLEEFLRVCGWCRKVCYKDEWLDMEKYFSSKFSTKTSHGMCPDCLAKKREELAPKADVPAIPE
ncbi:MAG TPA: hypothetical protein VFV23_03870 [Verrucomicrobiae bacterium]|nr:hypothetical protein [Verrucomicrobiae bacterium]